MYRPGVETSENKRNTQAVLKRSEQSQFKEMIHQIQEKQTDNYVRHMLAMKTSPYLINSEHRLNEKH